MTSLIFYWNKSDDLYIMDSDSLDLMGDQEPILKIALDVMNAGFVGVAVDTAKLASGKYFYGVNIRPDKPEGKIISLYKLKDKDGVAINRGYRRRVGGGTYDTEKKIFSFSIHKIVNPEYIFDRFLMISPCIAAKKPQNFSRASRAFFLRGS